MLNLLARTGVLPLAIGCTGTLSSYDRPTNPGDVGNDTGFLAAATGVSSSTSTGTDTVTGTGSVTATGVATGTSTGATGTTSYSGTSTGSGPPSTIPTTNPATTTTAFSLPSAPLDDGIYEGWVHIDYERDLFGPLPPAPNWSNCDGDITIEVDNSRSPVMMGSISNCEWPLWDIWAQLWLSDVDGILDGNPGSYGFADGDVSGGDGGDFIFDHGFTAAVVTGPRIAGLWTGSQPLVDSHEGAFVADWVAPLPTAPYP
jgi:hypothetical protein